MWISKKTAFGLMVAVLLPGCLSVQPTPQGRERSTFVVMKTPVLSYADQGFISKSADAVMLEIYASGVAVMKLKISNGQVCNGTGLFSCMPKEEFNKRYLSTSYPADTFEKILRGEPIFGGRNLEQMKGGFSQRLTQRGSYAIVYKVFNHAIAFHDTISHIIIKVKENR